MKVSRAAYYAHRTAGPSAHARQDAELTEQIAAIHDESNGTYGTPRLHAELRHRGRRRPEPGVIFHSDRGCQYTSAQFGALADQHGVRSSVGRKGQCWDNTVAESFFATITAESIDRRG
ncbi:IS3 family transposase [Amycolatopsis methanolica]|uniref:IS3 family transposase n=1 Tax=Amycolatopsis methanolica TaxID=1814 RepID=UPI003422257E